MERDGVVDEGVSVRSTTLDDIQKVLPPLVHLSLANMSFCVIFEERKFTERTFFSSRRLCLPA